MNVRKSINVHSRIWALTGGVLLDDVEFSFSCFGEIVLVRIPNSEDKVYSERLPITILEKPHRVNSSMYKVWMRLISSISGLSICLTWIGRPTGGWEALRLMVTMERYSTHWRRRSAVCKASDLDYLCWFVRASMSSRWWDPYNSTVRVHERVGKWIQRSTGTSSEWCILSFPFRSASVGRSDT